MSIEVDDDFHLAEAVSLAQEIDRLKERAHSAANRIALFTKRAYAHCVVECGAAITLEEFLEDTPGDELEGWANEY